MRCFYLLPMIFVLGCGTNIPREKCGEDGMCMTPGLTDCCAGSCVAKGSCPEGMLVCGKDFVEIDGECVRKVACTPGYSCPAYQHCSDESGTAACVCDEGHTGVDCKVCQNGYHPDINGACKLNELCPGDCPVDQGIADCSDSTGVIDCKCRENRIGPPRCLCRTGYHEESRPEGLVCIEDAVCKPDSCPEFAICEVLEDRTDLKCTCEEGRERHGLQCVCKVGTHDNGEGFCVKDATCENNDCPVNSYCQVKDDLSGYLCPCLTGYTGLKCGQCSEGYEMVGEICLPCDHQCSPGETGCLHNLARYECRKPEGSTCRHKFEVKCGTDHVCSEGVCVCNHECNVGQSGCINDTTSWQCSISEISGCRFKESTTCNEGRVCSAGACVCDHGCPEGSKGCYDDYTKWVCVDSEITGCRYKKNVACETDHVCSVDECVCDHGCPLGSKGCFDDDTKWMCVASEITGCRYKKNVECEAGHVCSVDECVCDHGCPLGSKGCFDENTSWVCSTSEQTGCRYKREIVCGVDHICTVDECVCNHGCPVDSKGCFNENTAWACTVSDETGCRYKKDQPCGANQSCVEDSCICDYDECGEQCCAEEEYCGVNEECTAEKELSPDTTNPLEFFGARVALDGDLIAVTGMDRLGKYKNGCVRYYHLDSVYPFQIKCGPNDHNFGTEIALSESHVLINENDPKEMTHPAVHFYERGALNADPFTVSQNLPDFGDKLDLDNNWAVVATTKEPYKAGLLMYQKTGPNTWELAQEITDPDESDWRFGLAVAIAGDWLFTTAVTNEGYGAVHIFHYNQSWAYSQTFDLPDMGDWNRSNLDAKGVWAVIGAPNLNKAYILQRTENGQYLLARKLQREDLTDFGQAVSVDEDLVAVGGSVNDGGIVVLYRFLDPHEEFVGIKDSWECCYGCSVAVNQSALVVGDAYASQDRGAAFVY